MPETPVTAPSSETPAPPPAEPAGPSDADTGANDGTADSVAVIADGLTRLSRAELQELDRIVTPRAAELFAKAFGPEIRELLGPLAESDVPEAGKAGREADGRGQAGGEASGGDAPDDEAALRALMRDPRYWRDKDPAVMDRVARGFARLYPG